MVEFTLFGSAARSAEYDEKTGAIKIQLSGPVQRSHDVSFTNMVVNGKHYVKHEGRWIEAES